MTQPSEPRTADWTMLRRQADEHEAVGAPSMWVPVDVLLDLLNRVEAAPDPVASPLALNIEADGSISRISGGPLEQPVYTKGTVGPFWDEIEAWRDGYRAGLSEAKRRATEGEGT